MTFISLFTEFLEFYFRLRCEWKQDILAFFKDLFVFGRKIYFKRERESECELGGGAEGKADSLMIREPDEVLDPRTPVS